MCSESREEAMAAVLFLRGLHFFFGASSGEPMLLPRNLMPIALSILPSTCWLGTPRPAS